MDSMTNIGPIVDMSAADIDKQGRDVVRFCTAITPYCYIPPAHSIHTMTSLILLPPHPLLLILSWFVALVLERMDH